MTVPLDPTLGSAAPATPHAMDVTGGPSPAAVVEPAAPVATATTPAEATVPSSPVLTIDQPSLLEQFDAKPTPATPPVEAKPEAAKAAEAEVKPTDPAATPEAKPDEVAKPAEPAAPAPQPIEPLAPIEYKFEWPATVTPDTEKVGAFTSILNEARVAPEVAQKLASLHAQSLEAYDGFKSQEQHRVFNAMRKTWNTDILADEVLGGAGHDTAMRKVAYARDTLVPAEMLAPRKHADGSPRLSEFEEFLRITGAGDHRVFNRILHNASRYVAERQADEQPHNFKPPKDNGKMPGSFAAAMYDNPRSQGRS